jgi:predicted  nucleic acid-binding Zn-ribbon protein
MQHHIVQELLVKILDACTSLVDSHRLSIYTTLVEHITTTLPSCESLRSIILHAVSSSELQGVIWGVVRYKSPKKDSMCRAYTALLHQSLNTAVVAMLLTLALTAQPTGDDLPPALTTALVSKQRQLGHGVGKCSHEVSIDEPTPVSLFQQKNTPYTGQHLDDWRDRLKSELECQGSYQRDSIVRSVAQICQDLETRCNTVEEPLRREKERTQELEQHILKLDERIASLEVQAADDRFHSEGLEDEKLIISEERNSLSAKLDHLQATSDEAIRKTNDVLVQAREDHNLKELELRSMILTHEETIRALENDIEAQSNAVVGLRHELADAQGECALRSQQLETVQHRFDDAERKLNDELQVVCVQSEEILQLKNQNNELTSQLQDTKTGLDAITVQLSDLRTSHQELEDSSREANKALNDRYTRDMEAAAAQAKDDYESLGAKLREAIQDGRRTAEAYDNTRKEHMDLQESVAVLEERLQELTMFCSEQEEELEELRTLRKNVLASMGLASQNPLEMRAASRAQKDITDPQKIRAPREHRRRKSAIHATDGVGCRVAQDATSTAMENVANASFASSDSHSSQNGSTPKRSKVQSTFKVPTMHTPYASRSIARKLSPIKRSALRQLSPNRRHTTVDFVALGSGERLDEMQSAKKRRNSLQGIEEADFDMEDFLTSNSLTPARFISGTGRIPDDDSVTATEL